MTDTFLTDEEVAAITPQPYAIPKEAYVPYGWCVAAMVEQAKAVATMQRAAEAMVQISTSLAFLALDKK